MHIIIKKYSNRRLYNTETSSYVTLEELAQIIQKDHVITVIDTKNGEDITLITLMQIILEQHNQGDSLLPMEFLRQAVKLHNSAMGRILQEYLSLSIDYFKRNQTYMENIINTIAKTHNPLNVWNRGWKMLNQQNINFLQMMLSSLARFNVPKHVRSEGVPEDQNQS